MKNYLTHHIVKRRLDIVMTIVVFALAAFIAGWLSKTDYVERDQYQIKYVTRACNG